MHIPTFFRSAAALLPAIGVSLTQLRCNLTTSWPDKQPTGPAAPQTLLNKTARNLHQRNKATAAANNLEAYYQTPRETEHPGRFL